MQAEPLAAIALGDLRGTTEAGCAVFRGVPYAAPPVGPLRFAPARPAAAWNGIRPAQQHGPVAPQGPSDLRHFMGDFDRLQGEDCLTLTVWTPGVDARRRPVLLWLHGGAFVSGAGSLDWYSGARLALAGDIVVVHANYRLGALGWLCWPGVAPGNMALSDQAMALRWVREHIATFGGDPDSITLGGQSAGANCTARLMLDPELRPMAGRVLLQSGGFGREPSTAADMEPTGRAFLHALQIDPDGPDVAERLQAVAVPDILRAQAVAEAAGFALAVRQQAWRPVLQQPMTVAALLQATASALAGKDVLVGVTADEGHAFIGGPIPSDIRMEAVADRFARVTGSGAALQRMQAALPAATPAQLMAELQSAHHFVDPARALAEQAAAEHARVHAYVFGWAPAGSLFGAGHCIDLAFVFGTWPGWTHSAMLSGGDPTIMAELTTDMQRAIIGFVQGGLPQTADRVAWDAAMPMRSLARDGSGRITYSVCASASRPASHARDEGEAGPKRAPSSGSR